MISVYYNQKYGFLIVPNAIERFMGCYISIEPTIEIMAEETIDKIGCAIRKGIKIAESSPKVDESQLNNFWKQTKYKSFPTFSKNYQRIDLKQNGDELEIRRWERNNRGGYSRKTEEKDYINFIEMSDYELGLFIKKMFEPCEIRIDETERFPMENVKKMAELGMMGIPFPKELGGAGGDVLSYIITVEELSKVCGTTGVIVSAHTSLCASLLYENGTPAQKEKYLIPLAKGEKIGAFGLTEPGAGTDAAGQQTTAVLDGDNYILNGSKIFITNGGVADTFIVFAMTDKSQGTRGISAFIVEKDFPGFSIGKKEDKLGIRASSTTELIFENCVVPKENLIGKEGKGFGIAMKTLDGGRIGIAAQALGIAEGAYEEAVKYMKERKQFGRPLSAFQGLQ